VHIIFLGAPGAGKGTQAVYLARKLKLTHIATGNLFRQAIEQGTELGIQIKSYVEKGILVPNKITMKMVFECISAPNYDPGIVFDGFPRNLEQARVLDQVLTKRAKALDKVVYIKVAREELLKRLVGRWICRNCQTPYHATDSPPKVCNKCDKCNGELYQRPDDTAETVKRRLQIYFTETAPLIDYYAQTGKLLEVDGEGDIEGVSRRMIIALHGEGVAK
jgi:adenylate kinase